MEILYYRYSVGDVINELQVLEQVTQKVKDNTCLSGYTNKKAYIVKCKHKHIFTVSEYKIKNKKCPVCTNKVCVKGINDVATTHPHLVKYFVNPEDATKVTYGSDKKCLMRCPDCGFEKMMKIEVLVRSGFSCNKCRDGFSYPEKIILNILEQLNVEFQTQLSKTTFEWCKSKRYDFYVPKYDLICETHGNQHYNQTTRKTGRTLEEEQKNDKLKREMALNNGIKHYIELDCRKSELEWIKNSIMSSELPKILSFKEDDIDWIECETNANVSLVLKTLNIIKSDNFYNIKDLSSKVGVHKDTMTKYLKILKNGNYDFDYETFKKKIKENNLILKSKKPFYNKHSIYMYDNQLTFIKKFSNCKELTSFIQENMGLSFDSDNISRVCRNGKNYYSGFVFSYEDLSLLSTIEKENFIKEKIPKSIYVYDLDMNFIMRFDTLKQAKDGIEKEFGVKCFHISDVCKNKRKSDNGYIFSYKRY